MALSHIFHISDLHIRKGDYVESRYLEYKQVFENTFDSIKQQIANRSLKPDNYIIIVTGDIFHNKNVIGNHGLTLYKQMLEGLTSIGRTILFHGNHDRNQNEVNQPSLVSSTLDIPNLTILHNTQSFVIDDIGFSYLSVDDTLDEQTTAGHIASLPKFPPITDHVKYTIALFHGPFANVRLYNGTTMTETADTYPFEMLDGFNYALLGDIHLRQKGTYKNTLWGYSGSLIQQNFGEDLIQHGYMLWDLHQTVVHEINVRNEIGLVNLRATDDGQLMIRIRGQYNTLLSEYIESNKDLFPKHLEIKLYSDVDLSVLFDILNKYSITCNILNKTCDNTQFSVSQGTTIPDVDIKINKDALLQHFSQYLSPSQNAILANILKSYDSIILDTGKFPNECKEMCLKVNKELSGFIDKCLTTDTSVSKTSPKFKVKYLEWKNLYCYEGVNWINFDNVTHSTFSVAGNNATGKSAIYDILTLSIWGEITLQKRNDLTAGIINTRCSDASTIVDIEVNGNSYRISRTFNLIANKAHKCNKHHIFLYKYVADNAIELIKKDNACNEEVSKLLGTLEDFLSSSMITQNVDCDILKMSYTQCLSVIDKTFDIEYIYNLFDLLKSATKKYKDLKKIIDSKKEVYEKIASSANSNAHNLDDLRTQVNNLEIQKDTLVSENNSIAVDINNADILNKDFSKLIAELGDIVIKSESEYQVSLEHLNELKVLLRGLSSDEIAKLCTYTFKELEKCEKPCELSFIQQEENELAKYVTAPQLPAKFAHYATLAELQEANISLQTEYDALQQRLKLHNDKKPTTSKLQNKQQAHAEINKMFSGGFSELADYCSNNLRYNCAHPVKIQDLSYCLYKSKKAEYDNLIKQQAIYKEKLADIDNTFRSLHSKQMKLNRVNRPAIPVTFRTSTTVKKELSKYDVTALKKDIESDSIILERFYKEQDDINALEKQLKVYEDELLVFNENAEYQYNPNCEYCCKRPWVCRKNEISIIIASLKAKIAESTHNLYDNAEHNYMQMYDRCEENKTSLSQCELLQEWYAYYLFKEEDDAISKERAILLHTKDDINMKLTIGEATLLDLATYVNTFNAKSFELFEAIAYLEWKDLYDDMHCKLECIGSDMKSISKWVIYEENTKPRKIKLSKMKTAYQNWSEYDQMNKIRAAQMYVQYTENIQKYEQHHYYAEMAALQPLIQHKTELSTSIKQLDAQIKSLSDLITKTETINAYNDDNIAKHTLLSSASDLLQENVELFDIIVDKFKEYRKELYETHILKRLVTNANNYLKTLCHNKTKMFEVDYLITEIKDIIHINWLVRNATDDDRQQVISIKQASGFQQFAISLALRMSMFSSKNCVQLFIDEGFTACDKQNLSIVPHFLKGLLKTFDTVVIVSHIDIIQDSVDNTAYIKYNDSHKSSSIAYGDQPTVVQKKRQLK